MDFIYYVDIHPIKYELYFNPIIFFMIITINRF